MVGCCLQSRSVGNSSSTHPCLGGRGICVGGSCWCPKSVHANRAWPWWGTSYASSGLVFFFFLLQLVAIELYVKFLFTLLPFYILIFQNHETPMTNQHIVPALIITFSRNHGACAAGAKSPRSPFCTLKNASWWSWWNPTSEDVYIFSFRQRPSNAFLFSSMATCSKFINVVIL